jgi:hypothetical protein
MQFRLRHARTRLSSRSWTAPIFQGIDFCRKLRFGPDFSENAGAKPITGKLGLSDVTFCIAG